MPKPSQVEFIPTIGYVWTDTNARVYQEELVHADGLPIGYRDYGLPWRTAELLIKSSPEGFWVMDGHGSYHRYPWKLEANAQHYRDWLNRHAK